MTYSSSLAVNRRQYAKRNQNGVTFAATSRTIGPVSNTIILLSLLCLIGLLYLTQVTKTNSFGYSVNGLREQQIQLKDDKQNLEVASARLQSLERVAASEVAKKMVNTTPAGTIR